MSLLMSHDQTASSKCRNSTRPVPARSDIQCDLFSCMNCAEPVRRRRVIMLYVCSCACMAIADHDKSRAIAAAGRQSAHPTFLNDAKVYFLSTAKQGSRLSCKHLQEVGRDSPLR
jgi:hypothetical protein